MNRCPRPRVFAALAALLVAAATEAIARGPNVLLIVSDDLRCSIGCYGDPAVKTPHIDRLAARGVRFDRAYVQYPICNPSRCSFLTGLRPDRTRVLDNTTLLRDRLPEVVTLPQLLRENGWHTASFGKIFHAGGGRDPSAAARWSDRERSWDEAHMFSPTPAGKVIEGRDLSGGRLRWCRWGMTDGTDDDQPDGQAAAAAVALIERLGDVPWMIGVGFHRPHDPFVAPKKYFDLYPSHEIELYRDPAGQTPAPALAVGFGEFGEVFRAFSDAERREFLRAYYAGTSFMDAQVGRLLDALDRRDLWEDTVVVFLGDHGYHLGERDWWNKNTLYERSCRAPLIVAAPGARPGVARGLVEFVDLYPTVADLCGVAPPAGLAGASLRPTLADPSRRGKESAHSVVTRGSQRGDSVRTHRWRYTEWSDGARELYDHRHDPGESVNLAGRTGYGDTIERLSPLLRRGRE